MDHSGKRLRKLLRYRSESSRDLGQLSAYWQDFTWNAGDIIVFHKGAWWGTPQVWAASQEEGQRVLRFAAAEAGIDPDQVGEWRAIHANKGQNTRINAYNEFRTGEVRGIVATDVAARGIDISEVTHVINFDVPVMYTDYVHRVGRTGRAEKEGIAITFATKVENMHVKKIEALIKDGIKELEIPTSVEILETTKEESKAFDREIDRLRRIEDPEYKGAFHERKGKKKNYENKADKRSIQAYKFIAEDDGKKKKRRGKKDSRKKR